MTYFKTLSILFLTVLSVQISAQAYEGKGDSKLNLGLSLYGYGSGLSADFDYGLSPLISIGGGGDFYFDNKDDHDFFLKGRLNFHLGDLINMPASMDLYPGVDLGLVGDKFGLGAHVGYRYFWSETLGVFIEIGSSGAVGLSINL